MLWLRGGQPERSDGMWGGWRGGRTGSASASASGSCVCKCASVRSGTERVSVCLREGDPGRALCVRDEEG